MGFKVGCPRVCRPAIDLLPSRDSRRILAWRLQPAQDAAGEGPAEAIGRIVVGAGIL